MESAYSIRSLYRHFLSGITTKSLNAFYYACSYAKVDRSVFMNSALCCVFRYGDRISYLAVPLGYRMWQKKESKLELASAMVHQVMPEFHTQKNVIILCDSWYVKQNLVSVVEEYENLDLIGNARADSVIYDLAPLPTGKKGRPAKHGRRLSIDRDFTTSPCSCIRSGGT